MLNQTAIAAVTLVAASIVSTPGYASTIYWNFFNIEEEASAPAIYVTYRALSDMLTDSNRLGSFEPSVTDNSARNVVGSGAFWAPEPPAIPLPAPGFLLASGLAAAALPRRATRIS